MTQPFPGPARIAVVGSGYVGTVACACFAKVGHQVVGLEVDESKLRELSRGRAPFFESGLDEALAHGVRSGRLRFTSDMADALDASDVVFLCVGTPGRADGRADMSAVETAASAIGAHLRHRHAVVTKSTVPIGSGRWLASVIEDALPPALRTDPPFSVVSNPEFLRQGSALEDFMHPDRVVVGGDDAAAVEAVAGIYRPIIDQARRLPNGQEPPFIRTDLATAEAIKYASNAFLATKISFINEVANICERVGADVAQVATAMGLDERIGSRFLEAGVGWGGSCFGKDLNALVMLAEEHGYEAALLRAAVAINDRQRVSVVEKLQRHLKTLRGRRVGILGLAFKPGTDDLRNAPSVEILEHLTARGCSLVAHDPVVRRLPTLPMVRMVAEPEDVGDRADAVVLVTEWPEYLGLDLPSLRLRMRGDLFLDGRNVFDPESVAGAGLVYEGVGRSPRRQPVPIAR
ncbi:MAG: UDP-glucose/GDP-mannose dehydrogenase family protein [Actinomycetota bacterium]|nr:UDP-glucose/GDP-mannose dehydrogenase family protein [Actinomycetota bacterium]